MVACFRVGGTECNTYMGSFGGGRHYTGMLLVPGMVFTIEPMINMGTWKVFVDSADGWTVITEDELPSAQWEHTFLMTETGLEILTH